MSLALSTLIYEWRRYLAAVIALAFSGFLVLFFVGLFAGIGKSFTATIDRSPAEIFILPPKAKALFGSGGQPRRILPTIYTHPEVLEVADLDGDGALFLNTAKDEKEVKRNFVQIMAVDPVAGAVNLPTDFSEQTILALQQPKSVVIDASSQGTLGVKKGDKAVLNGNTVYVGDVITGYPNIVQPMVVISRQTARLIGLGNISRRVGPLMVRLRNPARAQIVADELNASAHDQFRAWTRAELSKANEESLLHDNFIGFLLTVMTIIGAIIGVVITWQTLRGAIMANIKEFASLRALGVAMGTLRVIVVELSWWVGVAGLLATYTLIFVVSSVCNMLGLPLAYSFATLLPTSIMLIVIALLSGVFSLGVLKKSQPADLLR